MRAVRLTIFVVAVLIGGAPRADPSIDSVEPRQVFVDEAADLTINGEGIESDAWLAVPDGGPFVASTLEFPGETPGALARIDDRHVAVATNDALYVVNVSDPAAPEIVGEFRFPSNPACATSDGRVVAVGDRYESTVRIFDVGDRGAPHPVGQARTTLPARDVAIAGGVLHVGSGQEWRFVCLQGAYETFSLADSENPLPLASQSWPECVRSIAPGSEAMHLLTQGNEAPRMRLVSMDVTDPSTPHELSRLAWPNIDTFDWTDLAVDRDIGYVLQEYPPTFRSVDLTDPAEPVELHAGPAPLRLFRTVDAADGRLAVGTVDGVQWYDVRDPTTPVYLEQEQAESFGGLITDGALAYSVGYLYEDPLSVLDAGVPVRPNAPVLHEGVPGGFEYVFAGATAFAADLYVGVHVLDVRDPDAPEFVDTVTGLRSVGGIAAEGDVLYATDTWYGEVLAYDASDPSAVRLEGVLETGSVGDLTSVNRIVYAADPRGNGIRVLDFRDPGAPGYVTYLPLADIEPVMVERSGAGDRVYVLGRAGRWPAYFGTLHVLDATAPAAPRIAGWTFWAGRPNQLDVDDDFVWVADELAGVLRVEVTDPARPVPHVTIPIENALGVAVFGRWLAVSRGSLGSVRTEALVYDVTDDTDPRLHQQYALDRTVFGLESLENRLWFDYDVLTTVDVPPPPTTPAPAGSGAWHTTLPPGRPPGPYDVLVRNPDGGSDRARNVLRVCARRDVEVRLVPEVMPGAPVLWPVSWRVALDGEGVEATGAYIPTPPLDPAVVPRYVHSEGPDTLELAVDPDGSVTAATLSGPEEERLRARWGALRREGVLHWPWTDGGGPRGVVLDARAAPASGHRYVLTDDGVLALAASAGPEPDLTIVASGVDAQACRHEAATTLSAEIEALCGSAGPTVQCIGPGHP